MPRKKKETKEEVKETPKEEKIVETPKEEVVENKVVLEEATPEPIVEDTDECVVIDKRGRTVRIYSRKQHGEDFRKMALEYSSHKGLNILV
jgi:hypothetical protein